ncbi:GntR family transcriptional regulator [Salipiger marinus]|uniref:Transcriptional regulator, GntR family n=1 Tax=Salipiger marinus TaxID=555512 RepID=A0A1G8HSY2_9RHOB|nr:GntR family transcriptional regulator [Salipiger marinus]SDI09763.1 transcriptional regulator, GntR family [Salipiger marinus]
MKTDQDPVHALDPTSAIAPQIARILRDRIIRNQLSPGNRISESEIARGWDVSRQPVREAFIKLAEQGLVAILPQRGTVISRIAYSAVMDARFLREAIEADISTILAHRADAALVAELRAQLVAQERAAERDRDEFIALDERFHRTLAEAAGKGGAWKQIEGLKSQMDRVRFLSLHRFPMAKLIAQHSAIVEGIAQGDCAEAEGAIRRHMREILFDLPEILAANPEFFDLPEGDLPAPVNVPIQGGD